jgi:predicted MFS family arabinose efflux permease
MTPRGGAEPARVFYGWWVALAFAVIIFLSTGIRFTVGPFLKPMVADLGIDRGSFSLVVSLSLFLYGAAMPLVTSALSGDIFGRFSVGSICGTIFLVHQTGAALGTWMGGALFDATGGYGAAFAAACALLLVGAGLSLTIRAGDERPAQNPLAARRDVRPVAGGR